MEDRTPPFLLLRGQWNGAALGLAAAALFGASTPILKLMVPETGALVLAGLLYIGAAGGVWIYELAIRATDGRAEKLRCSARIFCRFLR